MLAIICDILSSEIKLKDGGSLMVKHAWFPSIFLLFGMFQPLHCHQLIKKSMMDDPHLATREGKNKKERNRFVKAKQIASIHSSMRGPCPGLIC